MSEIRERARTVLDELSRTVDAVDPVALGGLMSAISAARRVYFEARGRSGLVARALAMRWMHLGLPVHVAGETTTPAIGPADLLVCLSASGQTPGTLASAAAARTAGARVAALTGDPAGSLAETADIVLVVPGAGSAQHAGSLFEQACLVLGDAMCGVFQRTQGIPDAVLNQRHANLL
ncbi:6-phospho-3-hexuloisomerase [Allokutzneria albata]|uniref:3-hexulose-6-phosphate isomerase n=1 Tax=Allokutzneria albata TaxID=211114 RepID=A0A1G9SWM9_ALLAB|nr:6-phospho-3-hexuloisomerase [Allokutzneria albata]SDM39812.1 3-hexulose-6-phosphate isomerase [Allokutzneria albata]